MSMLRALYDWTIKWSAHPKSAWFLGGFSAIEGIFFPIPIDPFLVAMGASRPKRAIHFAMVAALTSVIGGSIGYFLGVYFWDSFSLYFYNHVVGEETFDLVFEKFNDNAFLAIFLAGFTPIPYKVFCISAGVAKVDFITFVIASICGRSLRFLSIGVALFFWGPSMKDYIDNNFNKVTIYVSIALIVFYIAFKYLF